jgi:hypothetical protein
MSTIKIKVWDADTADPNDPIAECTDAFYGWELEGGSSKIYYCGTGSDLILIEFSFSPWFF